MIGVIIQARLGSTRMPKKVMKEIMNKPLLYYSVKRSSLAKYVDKVIVATTTNRQDDIIAKWCEEENILYYRGNENDVLDRYYKTAKAFNIDTIVRITSDCPFIDFSIIDLLILYSKNFGYDDVVNRWKLRTWPHGLDAEVFTFKALEKAWSESKEEYEREHVTPYILRNPNLFSIYEVAYREDISNIRLTVDYEEDMEFSKQLMEILINKYGMKFTWKDILFELNINNKLLDINKCRINTLL